MITDKYDFAYLNQIRKEIIEKYYGKLKTSTLPGVDNDKIIHVYPDLRREYQLLTMCEIEILRRERRARRLARQARRRERRAQRPWYLRWF